MGRNKEKRLTWMHSNYRRRMIKFFYGITLEQFAEQMERQNGACAFCGGKPPENKFLSVDHAHGQHEHPGTKRGCPECVRGLLCINCNRSVLPVLEKNQRLQNTFIKDYLAQRPFNGPVVQRTGRSTSKAAISV